MKKIIHCLAGYLILVIMCCPGFIRAQESPVKISMHSESVELKQYEKTFFSHVKKLIEKSNSTVKKIGIRKIESTSDLADRVNVVKKSASEIEISYGESAVMDYALINPDSFSHEAECQILKQILSREEYVALIKSEFGVSLDLKPLPKFKLFTLAQTQLIYESLRDLSSLLKDEEGSLVTKMRLFRIRSSVPGKLGSDGKAIAAEYIRSENSVDGKITESEIRFYALEDHSMEFETILFHELGHAIWFNVLTTPQKKGFLDISWIRSDSPVEYKLKPGGKNEMATLYAMTVNCRHHQLKIDGAASTFCSIPTEDFPEHFALFISDSEGLIKKAPLKFEYLQTHLFGGMRFKDVGYANLTFSLRNGVVYDRAPGILSLASKVIGHEATRPEYFLTDHLFTLTQADPLKVNRITFLKLFFRKIKNVPTEKDEFIEFNFDLYSNNYLKDNDFNDPIIFDADRIHSIKSLVFEQKNRLLKASHRFDLKEIFAGDYELYLIHVQDAFSNFKVYDENEIRSLINEKVVTLKLPGLATEKSKKEQQAKFEEEFKLESLAKEINIPLFEKIGKDDITFKKYDRQKDFSDNPVILNDRDPNNIFDVRINRPHSKFFTGVEMNFESDQCNSYEQMHIENLNYVGMQSKPGDSNIAYTIYVDPRLYKCRVFTLRSITYKFYPGKYDQSEVVAESKGNEIQLILTPNLELYNFKPLKIDLDKIKFDIVPGPTKPYYSPKIQINLENWENKGEFYIEIKIRDTKGSGSEYKIFGRFSPEDFIQFQPGSPAEIVIEYRDYSKREKPTYFNVIQQGEYIIEEIKISTPRSPNDARIIHAHSPQYEQVIDLKTRKIVKKLDAN